MGEVFRIPLKHVGSTWVGLREVTGLGFPTGVENPRREENVVAFELTCCRMLSYRDCRDWTFLIYQDCSGANHTAVGRNVSDRNLDLVRINFVLIQDGITKPSGLLHELMIKILPFTRGMTKPGVTD